MKPVFFKVDGIGLNATAFSKMTEEQAVAEMTEGNILKEHKKDAAWARKAYKACVDALRVTELGKAKAGKQSGNL